MKTILKNTLITLICCFCVLSLASCSGGIKGDEAKALIQDFLSAIVAEDYDKAETFLHAERPADIESFFLSVEGREGIDFQAGISVEKYTRVSSSYYDSTVGGSRYELTLQTKVGENTVEFTVEVVKNEAGYGIYNLDLDT